MNNDANALQARISAKAPVVTLINVFTVDPANQEQLVELWRAATEDVMRHQPGFVSASIHRSYDGTKVIDYAQWESREAFAAMFQNPQASEHLTKLAAVGTPDPVVCEVVSVHQPWARDSVGYPPPEPRDSVGYRPPDPNPPLEPKPPGPRSLADSSCTSTGTGDWIRTSTNWAIRSPAASSNRAARSAFSTSTVSSPR
jgi:heme-degrading monooxygenase HmoA